MVDADPVRLSQVVANLLDNAAKFTPPGGRIRLAAATDGPEHDGDHGAPRWLVISVEDDGAGISLALLPRVFDQFVRGMDGPADSGLGLGLAVVKHLVELHGGTVAAHSDGPGHGSRFEVRLPIVLRGEHPAERAAPAAAVARATGQRVLIVDDNRDAADALALLLRIHGYRPTVAYDGDEAIEVAARIPPEIALVDLGLPGIDGCEVAQRLRQEPALSRVLLVALTGFGRESDRARSLEAGFHVHLVKPVSPDDLLATLAGASAPATSHEQVSTPRS
jgi:CheY-like chemotaxis protein